MCSRREMIAIPWLTLFLIQALYRSRVFQRTPTSLLYCNSGYYLNYVPNKRRNSEFVWNVLVRRLERHSTRSARAPPPPSPPPPSPAPPSPSPPPPSPAPPRPSPSKSSLKEGLTLSLALAVGLDTSLFDLPSGINLLLVQSTLALVENACPKHSLNAFPEDSCHQGSRSESR